MTQMKGVGSVSKLPVGSLVLVVDGPYQVIEIMGLGPVRPLVRWEDLEIWSSRSSSFSLPQASWKPGGGRVLFHERPGATSGVL